MRDQMKEIIKKYMIQVPKTRDDDALLYCYLIKELWIQNEHIYHIYKRLCPTTVVRYRRKIQEENPELLWEESWIRHQQEMQCREKFRK